MIRVRYCPKGHDKFIVGVYKDKFGARCKQCRRDYNVSEDRKELRKTFRCRQPEARGKTYLMDTYGITPEQYNEMYANQNGLCLGCYRHQSGVKQPFCVDHDHKTGNIRGLLCYDCNITLGKVRDSAEILERLAAYLRKSIGV